MSGHIHMLNKANEDKSGLTAFMMVITVMVFFHLKNVPNTDTDSNYIFIS